jgi:hypothetical protein
MEDKLRRLTEFLDQYINFPRSGPGPAFGWCLRGDRPSAEELAQDLLGSAEFTALGIGTWFGTPQGRFFADAVEAVSPPFYREDEELLVDGLTLAARLHAEGKQKAAGFVAIGAVVVAAIFFGRS